MQQPIKFYVCSVGEPTKDYARQNLNRIVTNSAFILHKDAKQKGVYEEIKPGGIVLLKFERKLIAYGKTLENRTTDDEDWNLWTVVKEWFFKDPGNVEDGVSLHGIGADTIAGGAYGTVKEVSTKFGWQKLQEINSLSSLHAELKNQVVIPNESESMNDIIDLLKYKKQIILQGPPGTGKTFKARQIAEQMIEQVQSKYQSEVKLSTQVVDIPMIRKLLKTDDKIPLARGGIITVKEIKDQHVTITNGNDNQFTVSLAEVFEDLVNENFEITTGKSYEKAIVKYVYSLLDKQTQTNISEDLIGRKDRYLNQVKLVQFHPAYSYEDFVRGITAKTSGSSVEYRTENRILAEFASLALKNYKDSKKEIATLSKEIWIKEQVNLFADSVQEIIDKNGKYPINDKVSIFEVDKDAFRYVGDSWAVDNKQRMKFSDLVISYLHNAKNRQDIIAIEENSGRAKQHASYDLKVLEKLHNFLPPEPTFENSATQIDEKPYILIIDEINRANLPAVLGELIYALEYRSEPVESTYDIDGDRTLILPPNLYIIGTMNTADRSVGHIDYAIRRRFAFVDVLPSREYVHSVAKDLFKAVSELFVSKYDSLNWHDPKPEGSIYIAADFRPEDIWIGHSYFMSEKQNDVEAKQELELRLKYEILPLLKEYLKDGLLMPNAEDKILKLHV